MGVYARLQLEVAVVPANETTWLLNLLEENDFWVHAVTGMHAKKACKLVMLQEPSYYSDIKVWLPEQQWGISAKERSMCIPASPIRPVLGIQPVLRMHMLRAFAENTAWF